MNLGLRRWACVALYWLLCSPVQAMDADALQTLAHASYTQAARALDREATLASTPTARSLVALQQLQLLRLYRRYHELEAQIELQQSRKDLGPTPALVLEQQLGRIQIALARGQAVEAQRQAQALRRLHPGTLEQAEGADRPIQDELALAEAAVAAELGQRDEATRSLTQLIRASAKRPLTASRAWLQLAHVQLNMADYQQGLLYHREALAAAPEWALQDQARARMGVAQMLNLTGQRPLALRELAAALAQFRLSDNLQAQADALLLQGYFLRLDGQLPAAVAPLRQALALREALHADADIINSLTHLGTVLTEISQVAEAVRLTRRAAELAASTDSARLQADAYYAYSNALAAAGEYRIGQQQMARAYDAQKRNSRLDLLSQTAALREQFESDRQRLENELLAERLRTQQQGERGLRWTLAAFAGLSLLLLLALGALARLYVRARHLAQHDGLTGLLNRRQMLRMAEAEIERARRYQLSLSLISLDLDHFKRINDEEGHAVGDRVLKELARLFRDSLRREDLAGRIGGEEFLLLLPHTDTLAALQLAERLRQRIEQQILVKPGWPVTASLGVCAWQTGQSLSDVMARADAALYEAKHQGRNRCALATPLNSASSGIVQALQATA